MFMAARGKLRLFNIIALGVLLVSSVFSFSPASTTFALPRQQEPAERFNAVKKWTGTFSIQADESISDPSIGLHYWNLKRSINGSIKAEMAPDSSPFWPKWVGSYQGSGSIHDEEKQSSVNCIHILNWDWEGAIGSGVRMFIDYDENTYLFYLDTLHTVEVDYNGRNIWCEDGELGDPWHEKRQHPWHPIGSNIFTLPLPKEGMVLEGTREIEGQWPGTPKVGWSKWTVSWRLEPADEEELELLVQPRDYDAWIPEGPQPDGPGVGRRDVRGLQSLQHLCMPDFVLPVLLQDILPV